MNDSQRERAKKAVEEMISSSQLEIVSLIVDQVARSAAETPGVSKLGPRELPHADIQELKKLVLEHLNEQITGLGNWECRILVWDHTRDHEWPACMLRGNSGVWEKFEVSH